MALDPLVVLCPNLQAYFVDKDSGAPLSGGVVTFYEDNDRTVLKPIYEINGNGPYSDASYVQLNNPLILSSVGTFMDNNGNDIIPYLFPYQGVPGNTNETIDLYYVTVYSSAGVLQFTREAWPNTASSGTITNNELINYIPNPQFLLHSDDPITTNVTTAVPSSADVTYIAQGGWTFQVPHGTASVNEVSFVTNTTYFTSPDVTGDPRYLVDIECSVPSNTDTFKDLCIAFPDVNKFASASTENNYTFSFQGASLSGASLAVQIRLLKYFGSGGSPSSSTDVPFGTGNLTIGVVSSIYNIQGLFGNNSGMTLGSNNDDYLQIAIRLPNLFSHIQLTDFILTNGDVTITGFPVTTNSQMLDASTAGWLPTPNPDGSDLYLPVVLTPQGMTYDMSPIGKVYIASANGLSIGELNCDGSSYLSTGYSSDGIPYSRLFNKYFNNGDSYNVPKYGTGATFVTNYISAGVTSLIMMTTNQFGTQTAPSDGSNPTGFSFSTLNVGSASPAYNFTGYTNGSTLVWGICNTVGSPSAAINAETSTMTVNTYRNDALSYYVFQITAIAASHFVTGGTALYFEVSNTTTTYAFWLNTGTETVPSPAGSPTLVQIALNSSMSAADVAIVISNALSGYVTWSITTVAASAIPQSSFFTFYANSVQYTAWYNKANGGTVPMGQPNPIEIALIGTETAAQVATATQIVLNSYQFAVPNYQGLILRGQDVNAIWDIDNASRFSQNNSLISTALGTLEIDQLVSHLHSLPGLTGLANNAEGSSGSTDIGSMISTTTTGLTGGSENRPVNIYVNYVVKY